jgi:outer membrane protein W
MNSRKLRILTVAAVAALAIAAALPAAAGDAWHLRVGGAYVVPDLEASWTDDEGYAYRSGSNSSTGIALGLEYRFTEAVGLELGYLTASPEVVISGETFGWAAIGSDDLRFGAVTAGINLHLTPRSPVDLYLGALVATVDYSDVSFSLPGGEWVDIAAADDFAYGASIGADVKLGGGWTVNAAVTYLDSEYEATVEQFGSTKRFDFTPLVYVVRLGYRF